MEIVIHDSPETRFGNAPVERLSSPCTSAHLRLLVLAHANRSAGARWVAINLLRVLTTRFDGLEVFPVVPVGYDYETVSQTLPSSTLWFHQKGSFLRRLFFDRVTLPRYVRSLRPDVILALGSIGVRNPGVPQAILVQDSHFVYAPRHYGPMTVVQQMRYVVQRRQVRHCLQRAEIVYCQTPTMLGRVRGTFQIRASGKLLPKSISTDAVEGLDETTPPPEFAPFAHSFRMICLTRYNPHKNLEGIVEMFQRFPHELKDTVVFLTISPEQHPGARRLLRTIERFGLSQQIVNVGPIEQKRIPAYFKNCHALLFPTLMESFSATYLEAMAFDLPVLTSDLDFAREICGSAALYFDPWSGESIVEAIARIRGNAELRQSLLEAGRARLRDTHSRSWEDIAGAVVADLKAVASAQSGSRGRVPRS